jgi:flagella basal body P-ring formation protein FlgA
MSMYRWGLASAVGALLLLGLPSARPATAEEFWQASRTLLPGDTVRIDDVEAKTPLRSGADNVPTTRDVVGLEIKRRVYSGRPLTTRDIGPRSAVKANTPVAVFWSVGALSLQLDGRALETGAIGDAIRVLNPATSRTIRATVVGEGTVNVRAEP